MFFEGACENLVVPCADGSFGVQAHHSNMISAVTPGELALPPRRGPRRRPEKIAAVSAGLIKVERNDVLVLVDTAERPEEIDANRARPRRRPGQGGPAAKTQHPGIPGGPVQPGPRHEPPAGAQRL